MLDIDERHGSGFARPLDSAAGPSWLGMCDQFSGDVPSTLAAGSCIADYCGHPRGAARDCHHRAIASAVPGKDLAGTYVPECRLHCRKQRLQESA